MREIERSNTSPFHQINEGDSGLNGHLEICSMAVARSLLAPLTYFFLNSTRLPIF